MKRRAANGRSSPDRRTLNRPLQVVVHPLEQAGQLGTLLVAESGHRLFAQTPGLPLQAALDGAALGPAAYWKRGAQAHHENLED